MGDASTVSHAIINLPSKQNAMKADVDGITQLFRCFHSHEFVYSCEKADFNRRVLKRKKSNNKKNKK